MMLPTRYFAFLNRAGTLVRAAACCGTALAFLFMASAPAFAAGEKWILFLLPTYKTFPVVGLSHGAFRVPTDTDGVERVFHGRRRTQR